MEKKTVAHKKTDYKRSYPINMRLGVIGALVINIALFALVPRFEINPQNRSKTQIFEVEEILEAQDQIEELEEEQTAVPIAAESEEEVEAATIAETDIREIYKKPEDIVDIETVPYHKVEEKPRPKYSPKPAYPEAAKRAGKEGKATVEVLVDVDGTVMNAKLISSTGYDDLDQAALQAAWKWTFTPAKQRNKPVRVPVRIPFTFTLSG
jgi:protein TonB